VDGRFTFFDVKKLEPGLYQCLLCGAVVETDADGEPPLSTVVGKGEQAQRVVTINLVEIHRCPFPPKRS
jgi:hypothetical protein